MPLTNSLVEQDDDEVYELNLFTVEADETIGYQATSTLAGTGLKTNLRGVAESPASKAACLPETALY